MTTKKAKKVARKIVIGVTIAVIGGVATGLVLSGGSSSHPPKGNTYLGPGHRELQGEDNTYVEGSVPSTGKGGTAVGRGAVTGSL
jgi:hypothetical protein